MWHVIEPLQKQTRLGQLLLEAGLITEQQLESALLLQKVSNNKLGQILIEEKLLKRWQLVLFLRKQFLYRLLIGILALTAIYVPPVRASSEVSINKANTATSIMLTIPPRIQAIQSHRIFTSALQSKKDSHQISTPLCIQGTKSYQYSIIAIRSNNKESFTLLQPKSGRAVDTCLKDELTKVTFQLPATVKTTTDLRQQVLTLIVAIE